MRLGAGLSRWATLSPAVNAGAIPVVAVTAPTRGPTLLAARPFQCRTTLARTTLPQTTLARVNLHPRVGLGPSRATGGHGVSPDTTADQEDSSQAPEKAALATTGPTDPGRPRRDRFSTHGQVAERRVGANHVLAGPLPAVAASTRLGHVGHLPLRRSAHS